MTMKAGRFLTLVAMLAACGGGEALAAGTRVLALGPGRGYDLPPHLVAVLPGSSMSAARAAIEADGFTITATEAFGIGNVVSADIVFIGLMDPSQSLTTADRIGLLAFVLNGGALIYMGDNDFFRTPNNSVGALFGVGFRQDSSATSASQILHQLHPIIRGPAGTVTTYDASLNLPGYFGGIDGFGSNVTPIMASNERTFVAVIERDALQPGSGPVIFISEANGFMNSGIGTFHLGDNRTLWRNIFAFAAGMSGDLCITGQDCDDGVFCNGAENCVSGHCVPGDRPCAPHEGCHENTDSCGPCTADDQCADGVFCNGVERCESGVCGSGSRPCAEEQGCHEDTDLCGPCDADDQCRDDLFCNGREVCLPSGLCGHADEPCTGDCDTCDESSLTCRGCLVDLDHDGVIGTGDFAQFAGCFGACYPPNDPCLVANFDGSADGCIGSGDFAPFAGCFGGSCVDCTNCSLPDHSLSENATAAAGYVVLELVAVPVPTPDDRADVPPMGASVFEVGQLFHVEVWASNVMAGAGGIASAYLDLEFDETKVGVQSFGASRAFALFAKGTARSNAVAGFGGCALLGEKMYGADPAWVRVASVRAFGTRTGETTVTTATAGDLYGVSLIGEFGNLHAGAVSYGSLNLRFVEIPIDSVDVQDSQTAQPLPRPRH